jgi:hypothetical protein
MSAQSVLDTGERLQVWGYTGILLFPVNGYTLATHLIDLSYSFALNPLKS